MLLKPIPMDLNDFIRDIPDFPKQGVGFKDITPLLLNPEAVQEAVKQFIDRLDGHRIDKVVGIESRGFFFSTLLADACDAGFVPIRKPGKLPYHTFRENYDLEYGTDTLEIHVDAIEKGDKVLIHDDVLATGGTAAAAIRLIEKMGGEIVQLSFLMELSFLNGKDKLNPYEVVALLKY